MAGPETLQLTINDINFKVKKIILKSYIFTTAGTVDLYTIISSNLFDNYNLTGINVSVTNSGYLNSKYETDKYINGTYNFNFTTLNGALSNTTGDLILTWEFHGED